MQDEVANPGKASPQKNFINYAALECLRRRGEIKMSGPYTCKNTTQETVTVDILMSIVQLT